MTFPPCSGSSIVKGMNILNFIASTEKITIHQIFKPLHQSDHCGPTVRALKNSGTEILSIEKSKGGWSAYNASLRNEKINVGRLSVEEQAFMDRIMDIEFVSAISNSNCSIPSDLSSILPFLVAYSVVYDIEIPSNIPQLIAKGSNFNNGLDILIHLAHQKKMTIRDLHTLFYNVPQTGDATRQIIEFVKKNAGNGNCNPSTNEIVENPPPVHVLPPTSMERKSSPISNCISVLKAWSMSHTLPTALQLYEIDGLADILAKNYSRLLSLKDPFFLKIQALRPDIEEQVSPMEKAALILLTIYNMSDYDLDKLISALSLISEKDVASREVKEVRTPPKKNLQIKEPAVKNTDDGKSCCVCMDSTVRVVFLPCKHMVCCADCSTKVNNCPWCRTVIDQKISVYIP